MKRKKEKKEAKEERKKFLPSNVNIFLSNVSQVNC